MITLDMTFEVPQLEVFGVEDVQPLFLLLDEQRPFDAKSIFSQINDICDSKILSMIKSKSWVTEKQ